jgi:C1A family cysteine protease
MKDVNLSIGQAEDLNNKFLKYAGVYNVNVNSVDEYALKLENFKVLEDRIGKLNAKNSPQNQLELNKFSQLSSDELNLMMGFDVKELEREIESGVVLNKAKDFTAELSQLNLMGPLPEALDLSYTHHSIYNQGTCGSCYSFSAVAALEARIFYKHGIKVSLSQQQAVDCSKTQGNNGCHGGLQSKVYQYIMDGNDIAANNEYEYTGRVSRCQDDQSSTRLATVSDYTIAYSAAEGGLAKDVI